MSARIRGKEASIGLAVNGQTQNGSFLKVRNWEVNPDAPLTKTPFCGESRLDGDTDFNGYDFSFEIEELDAKAEDLLGLMDANQAAGIAPPQYVVTTFKKYRQAGEGSIEHVYQEVVLTCTQSTRSEGSSYVGSKWSGFAPRRDTIK